MTDPFGRTINYLRVSVTDRCNLRCRYCMTEGGVQLLPREAMLSFDEIAEVVREAAGMGFRKVRLTGGEPLVRRDLELLVELIAAIDRIEDLAMTTNGTLLAEHADALAAAGLQRVNISLDAVDAEHYAHITRGGDVHQVFAGIEAARDAGLSPIKLNCVVNESAAESDAVDVARFARDQGLAVRFIHQMDTVTGSFSVVEGGSGGDCPRCNRLRLSSDGMIRPCLFSDLVFSVRDLGPAQALRRAIREKPQAGGPCTHNWMYGIGG